MNVRIGVAAIIKFIIFSLEKTLLDNGALINHNAAEKIYTSFTVTAKILDITNSAGLRLRTLQNNNNATAMENGSIMGNKTVLVMAKDETASIPPIRDIGLEKE
jgi:hypothetical protein